MRLTILIFSFVMAFIAISDNSQAGLGWTYNQCIAHYGQPTEANRMNDGSIGCAFTARGYSIIAFLTANIVTRIVYIKDNEFDTAHVNVFLESNCPGTVWRGPHRDEGDNSYRWTGTKDGEYAFSAALVRNGHSLIIWTRADDDIQQNRVSREASGL